MKTVVSLGLDFGTESVRAILVDCQGRTLGLASSDYKHGQIVESLPGSQQKLPLRYALQSPNDWIESSIEATAEAIAKAKIDGRSIVGIGVDFTSCTMLPTLADGTPLCNLDELKHIPLAWPKLWKHHGAIQQTQRMNEIAKARKELFLNRYGGQIGLEWFFPKILETIDHAPQVAQAAQVWLEAGDWFVWQLVGGSSSDLTRSTCQAGYKAMWSASDGYPSPAYFEAVHPMLAQVVATKLPGNMKSPGQCAGGLNRSFADRMGMREGTPVSTAIIDAHSAVPGVGAATPGTLVMVMGTSSCHMLNSTRYADVPGVAGVVQGGILPDMFGYETGQAAVGDAFAWLKKLLGLETFDSLAAESMDLPPGAEGVRCLDWMNGCRTPLMNGNLRGSFHGLGLEHGPQHLYRALMEASGFGLRWIVEILQDGGVPIDRLVATGGLPHHNRAFVEIYANILAREIEIHPSTQGPAVGAAVLGMIASGKEVSGFESVLQASQAMASVPENQKDIVRPNLEHSQTYESLYREYRSLAANNDGQARTDADLRL